MRKDLFPGWFYGPNGEAEIFQKAEDVPKGWEDAPQKVKVPAKSKAKEDHDL